MISYDRIRAKKRLQDHYDSVVKAEEGDLTIHKVNSRLEWHDSVDGLIEDCESFISSNETALIRRVETLKLLGVDS